MKTRKPAYVSLDVGLHCGLPDDYPGQHALTDQGKAEAMRDLVEHILRDALKPELDGDIDVELEEYTGLPDAKRG